MAASIPLVSPNTPPRQIAALLLLSAIAYWPAWQSFFVKDDLTLITSADLDLAAALQHAWPGGFFRPAGELVFAIQHQFFGLYPLPYHLMSFIAHSAAVLFAYHLFRLFPPICPTFSCNYVKLLLPELCFLSCPLLPLFFRQCVCFL